MRRSGAPFQAMGFAVKRGLVVQQAEVDWRWLSNGDPCRNSIRTGHSELLGRFRGWKPQCLERLYGLMKAEAYRSDLVRGRLVDLAGGYRSLRIVIIVDVAGVSRGGVGCTDPAALDQTSMMVIWCFDDSLSESEFRLTFENPRSRPIQICK